MCDYSLHHVANRPAQIQDKLVTTKFKNSITRGFAEVGEPHVAVCLKPGTEIAFELRSLQFFLITAGYPLVGLLLMGAILGGWRKKVA